MNKPMQFYPVALTIAGSDSGGGAGIQADLRTFAAFGVFGTSAVTAVTAQNPTEVLRIDALPGAAVQAQLQAVHRKFAVGAIKTGMLVNAEIIRAVATEVQRFATPLIVDPVMVSTSGARLLEEAAIALLQEELLPLADWITPNRQEAELLTGRTIGNRDDMVAAGQECARRWQCSVIIKGGHLDWQEGLMTDVVIHDGKALALTSPVVEASEAGHGTGCTFSAALAAGFALAGHWKQVVKTAKAFVYGSLQEEVVVGPGIHAMYPPLETYDGEIELTRIDN
ncbi:MAG: bifunctional hydroxymethylpyrimidine kinase/phosphomethylpyrimidine kinase [Victivallales bacterium]|nr:bifunctional hydroxymethylpyrimidine kinase/phosphomethylpyrimidine kinase [Victivallales bacterium]